MPNIYKKGQETAQEMMEQEPALGPVPDLANMNNPDLVAILVVIDNGFRLSAYFDNGMLVKTEVMPRYTSMHEPLPLFLSNLSSPSRCGDFAVYESQFEDAHDFHHDGTAIDLASGLLACSMLVLMGLGVPIVAIVSLVRVVFRARRTS